MSIIFLLIPLAIGLLAVALGAFLWAVRNRQFDDLDTPAIRILFDDDEAAPPLAREPGHDGEGTRPEAPARPARSARTEPHG